MTNLNPIGERILVEVEDVPETKTASGILLVDPNKNKNELSGKVLAVGSGLRTKDGVLIPMTVKIGDTILFPKSVIQETVINSKKYVIVKESDIYGIF